MKKLNSILLWCAVLVLAAFVFLPESLKPVKLFKVGSVTQGNEYYATTTPSGAETWTDQGIKRGQGALGSVVITKAGNVEFVLYNATSTGAVLNDSRFNKSLKQLARIPENLVAGGYVFYVTFTDGLVMDVERGTTGTSTITYR